MRRRTRLSEQRTSLLRTILRTVLGASGALASQSGALANQRLRSGLRLGVVAGFVAAMVGSLVIGGFTASPAAAQSNDLEACPADRDDVAVANNQVRILKVAGLIDPVVKDYLLTELDKAEAGLGSDGEQGPEVLAVILWVNSHGSILNDDDYMELATRLRESPLQVAFWVGQTGSTARGGAAELATVADLVGVTPNSTIGEIGPARLPAEWGGPFADADLNLANRLLTADEAIQAGLSVGPLQNVVNIGSFATSLDGFEVLQCRNDEGQLETLPRTQAQISGLSLTSQLFHTVASPEVAYLFFTMGLALLVFELFTAGVGVAGVLGAGFLALGCYGLAELPTRWWAIALLLGAMVLLAIDIQTNVPRLYTILGLSCFVIGSWMLYDGVSMSRITLGVGIIAALLYAYTGMPSMVRTRFSTPTIGRKWMIGELGSAITDVDPEGTVKIRDVTWRAITNRATPVEKGENVRVVGIDRLVLEIEPEEGGAKDYRERS